MHKKLSEDLRLPVTLNNIYIRQVLGEIESENFASQKSGRWELTSEGQNEAGRVPATAAQQLLQSRTIIREALEASVGRQTTDTQFDAIWSALLDVLTSSFTVMASRWLSINAFLEQSVTEGDTRV